MKKVVIMISLLSAFAIMLSSCSFNYSDGQTDVTETESLDTTVLDDKDGLDDREYTFMETLNGTSECQVHIRAYHYPTPLFNLVGRDAYMEWIENAKGEDYDENRLSFIGGDCPYPKQNITAFIDHFGITREQLTSELVDYGLQTLSIYDLDVIYDGTEEEVSDYFKDFEVYYCAKDKVNEYEKLSIKIKQNYDMYLSSTPVGMGSVPELVYAFGISRDELEGYIRLVKDERLIEVKSEIRARTTRFNYDLDWLYSEDNPAKFSFDDDPTNNVSPRELDKMFCRLGEYAE